MTLTSSPQSDGAKLGYHVKVLLQRIERKLGYKGLVHIAVQTREGYGVAHLLLAWRPQLGTRQREFWIGKRWLREQWLEIHGAHQADVRGLYEGRGGHLGVARYLVQQYVAGQDALVRMSYSWGRLYGFPLAAVWRWWVREFWGPGRFARAKESFDELLRGLAVEGPGGLVVSRASIAVSWKSFAAGLEADRRRRRAAKRAGRAVGTTLDQQTPEVSQMTLREAVEQGIMREEWPSTHFPEPEWRDMNTWGQCLHCGRVYQLGDMVWTPNDGGLWLCSSAPTCDGLLVDFVIGGFGEGAEKRSHQHNKGGDVLVGGASSKEDIEWLSVPHGMAPVIYVGLKQMTSGEQALVSVWSPILEINATEREREDIDRALDELSEVVRAVLRRTMPGLSVH